MAIAHMNSQTAVVTCTIRYKSVNIPPGKGEEAHEAPPIPEELLAVNGCRGRKPLSFSSEATGKLPM